MAYVFREELYEVVDFCSSIERDVLRRRQKSLGELYSERGDVVYLSEPLAKIVRVRISIRNPENYPLLTQILEKYCEKYPEEEERKVTYVCTLYSEAELAGYFTRAVEFRGARGYEPENIAKLISTLLLIYLSFGSEEPVFDRLSEEPRTFTKTLTQLGLVENFHESDFEYVKHVFPRIFEPPSRENVKMLYEFARELWERISKLMRDEDVLKLLREQYGIDVQYLPDKKFIFEKVRALLKYLKRQEQEQHTTQTQA